MVKCSEVNSIHDYEVIIVGSPIYMGKWNKEASLFIKNNQNELKHKSLFFFSVGMSFDQKDPQKMDQFDSFLKSEKSLAKPISEGRFLGKMDFSKLSFFNKLIAKMVGAKNEDKQNWKDIETFVENIRKLIS